MPREPRTLKRDVKLSCTSPLTVRLMVFVVLGRLLQGAQLRAVPRPGRQEAAALVMPSSV